MSRRSHNAVYLSHKEKFDSYTQDEFIALSSLCDYASKLYDLAHFNVRSRYKSTGDYLFYNLNVKTSSSSKWYELLGEEVSDIVIKRLDRDYQSFFRSHELRKKGIISTAISRPSAKTSSARCPVTITSLTLLKDAVQVDLTYAFKKKHGISRLTLPATHPKLTKNKLAELRIHRSSSGEEFWLEYVYECLERTTTQISSDNIEIVFDGKTSNIGIGFEDRADVASGEFLAKAKEWYLSELEDVEETEYAMLFRLHSRYEKIIERYISNVARFAMNHALLTSSSISLQQSNVHESNKVAFGMLEEKVTRLGKRYGVLVVTRAEQMSLLEHKETTVFDAEFLHDAVFRA